MFLASPFSSLYLGLFFLSFALALPSTGNVTLIDEIRYNVPQSTTSILIILGIAIPQTAALNHFLDVGKFATQDHINRRGHDYLLAEDGEDPLDLECVFGGMKFIFHASSPATADYLLTWSRVKDTLQGLQDVLVRRGVNRLPRRIDIFEVIGDNQSLKGSATLQVSFANKVSARAPSSVDMKGQACDFRNTAASFEATS